MASLFWVQFAYLNIALAVFNLIPLPPLDGYRLIKVFAPNMMSVVERYGMIILLVFVVIFIRGPGAGLLNSYISMVSIAIFEILMAIVTYPL